MNCVVTWFQRIKFKWSTAMNSEAEKVNARPNEIRKILAGKGTTSDWYNGFIWRATPQGTHHWVDVMDKVKPLSEADRKYLESLLEEEEKMTSFVGTKTVKTIKEGHYIDDKVWVGASYDDEELCLYVGDASRSDYEIFDKNELRELIAGLTEVLEVLED